MLQQKCVYSLVIIEPSVLFVLELFSECFQVVYFYVHNQFNKVHYSFAHFIVIAGVI